MIRSSDDGYALFFSFASLSANVTLFGAKYKFDPIKDLVRSVWTSAVPLVLTLHPSALAKSVKELAALSERTLED